jgi:hypothetical protein
MKGWLAKTHVITRDGRTGIVKGDHDHAPYRYPEIIWDDGSPNTWFDGDLLDRAPDDWGNRSLEGQ